MPYRPSFEAPRTTVSQERQSKAQLQYSWVAAGINCEAQNSNFCINFCIHCAIIITRETITYRRFCINSRARMSSFWVLVNMRWVRGTSASKALWFYNDLATKSVHNLWMVSTLAKFLKSGPALGYKQLEHAWYTVNMWMQFAKFDAEKVHMCASRMQTTRSAI